jgi:hypothetical protein
MKLKRETGTLHTELTEALAHIESAAANMGMHLDELVDEFHHSNLASPAEGRKSPMQVLNYRKKQLTGKPISAGPSCLSVIR